MDRRALAALVVALTCATAAAHADQLVLGVGGIGMWHHSAGSGTAAVLNADYRMTWRLPYVSPLVGGLITSDADAYARAGLYHDFALSPRLTLTPHFSIGAYHHGSGQDLGAGLEFQTGLDLTYDMRSYRIGIGAVHISNNGYGSRNPGTEALMLLLDIPSVR
ncbi:MAG TPA: acyloxyacyl hydrolase [Casimicrobiaceae bacterium]|nr:acyloxyacyl hydrolase [Casimicrobiaceae bacterium]